MIINTIHLIITIYRCTILTCMSPTIIQYNHDNNSSTFEPRFTMDAFNRATPWTPPSTLVILHSTLKLSINQVHGDVTLVTKHHVSQ